MRKIKGILFDFDGVIADSEKLWFSSAISTLKKMNIAYDKSINQKSTIGIISEHLFKTTDHR
jgi:beta-phosphoglucomutase-like phosphatase (HAD superfamily)